jgi:hypothetical protein
MNHNVNREKLFQGICLITAQLIVLISTFFWDDNGRYTIDGAVMIIIAMVFWIIGFTAIFDLLKEKNPWYARLGLWYAVYGCAGGIAFGFEGLYSVVFDISDKIGMAAFEKFPMHMNIVLFWAGPAFPLTLIILGIMLFIRRIGNKWVNLLFTLGGIAFPISRISRIEWIAVVADILLLIPVVVISIQFIRGETLNEKKHKLQ